MRPDRLIAAAAAAVVAGGIATAAVATSSGDGPTHPTAATRPAPQVTTPRSHPAPAPMRSHRARPKATPAPLPPKPAPSPPLYPLPAPAAYPHPCPPPPLPPGPPPPPPPKPKVPESKLPAALKVAAQRHVDLRPISGKGMWVTVWADSTLDVHDLIAKATAAHLQQIWIRTSGTFQGWYGDRFLDPLVPAAHAAGIDVIAWDFPTMSDPVADAHRARLAIQGTFGGQHIDGFSPDIETINEGTFNSPRRVRLYLSYLRHYAGDMPIVATVMRPTDYQLATYPYKAEAPYVDAFAPMVYWSCNEPGETALASLEPLLKMRPVHLVGQSYDMADEGGRHGLPTGREIWRFLDVAKRHGAIGASLYLYEETARPQWQALGRYPWQ